MPYKIKPQGECAECRRDRVLSAKGLCGTCYNRQLCAPISAKCEQCGEEFTRRVPLGQMRRFCSKSCSNTFTAARLGDMNLRCKSAERVVPLEDRFWTHVIRHDEGCWEWDGAKYSAGYGSINKGAKGLGATGAHRVSWEIHNGPIPDGLHVLHECDNPPCTRPDHLFLGTNLDNIKDRVAKGRSNSPGMPGSRHPAAKLTEEIVTEAKRRRAAGETAASLAREYGVTTTTMCDATNGRHWRHVA